MRVSSSFIHSSNCAMPSFPCPFDSNAGPRAAHCKPQTSDTRVTRHSLTRITPLHPSVEFPPLHVADDGDDAVGHVRSCDAGVVRALARHRSEVAYLRRAVVRHEEVI